jgi:hypothetical protein
MTEPFEKKFIFTIVTIMIFFLSLNALYYEYIKNNEKILYKAKNNQEQPRA